MYVILSGQVKISKVGQSREKVLALLGAGDIIGEMAIINRKPRSAIATVTEKTEVMVLTKENFEQILASKPQFLVRLIQVLCNRIWFTSNQMQSLSIKSAPGRIASMLVLLTEMHKKTPDQTKDIFLYITPKDLSQLADLDGNEVDKMLNDLGNRGAIKVVNGLVIVANLEEMKVIADFHAKKERFKLL